MMLPSWITQERLLAIVSILAFLMSLFSWIHTWVYQRKNLRITIAQYYRGENYHYYLMVFENRSRLPISISRIRIMLPDNQFIQSSLIPVLIYERTLRTNGKIVERKSKYTTQFPITISPLGGISEFVVFQDDQEIFEPATNGWIFQVDTNRGRSFRLKLPSADPVSVDRIL